MISKTVLILSAFLALAGATPLAAQVESIRLSPDITLTLGGVLTNDHDVASDNLSGAVALENIGAIPANADLAVYHALDNGDVLLAFDITIELPGALVATPSDVVRYDGVNYTLEFDGSAQGVPAGTRIDALSAAGDGDLLFSFDTTVALSGLTVADEDVVEFDGANFSMLFDGSAAGVPEAADVDALHFAPESGDLYVSLDIGGVVDTLAFNDDDLLRHNPGGGTWATAYNGIAEHAAWAAGDLDAAFVTFLFGFIFKDGFEDL